MAMAPPLTLSLASSMPSSRMHAITCAPKASLISKRSMSESLRSARSSTALRAGTGRQADGGAGETARERGLAGGPDVGGGGDGRGRRAIDDGRRIAAGLHPAEGRPDGGQRLERGGAHMGVGGKLLHALELERARLIGRA